jgi:hypothetical protein
MDEEIKLFKQEKKTFDEERRKFTEAAIKLGQEVSSDFSSSLCEHVFKNYYVCVN